MPNEKSPLLKNGGSGGGSGSGGSGGGSGSNSLAIRQSSISISSSTEDPNLYLGVDKRTLFNTPECGISTVEAARRLKTFGPNEFGTKEKSPSMKFLEQFWGPLPIFIWIAIFVELLMGNFMDFVVLLGLQLFNGSLSWYEELKAGNAIAALRASLKPEAQVIRDGVHQTINASLLVPGDRITLSAGGAVPADCDLCEGSPIQVDQASLTGESFPVTIGTGDNAKMGSTVVRGEIEAIVTATGSQTFVGKNSGVIGNVEDVCHFQRTLLKIMVLLVTVGFVMVGFCLGFLLYNGDSFLQAIAFCVVLLVASTPIAMQVVCTSTMALGSRKLAEEKVIVTQLQSIETLSGMNMLCSDKTGTLTRNKMELQDDLPIFFPGATREDVLVTAALAAKWKEPPRDALDTLVLNVIDLRPLDQYLMLDHMSFDPTIKRTESTIRGPTGKVFKVTKGAPQVVLEIAHNVEEIRESVEQKVLDLARRGIRSLAVARTDDSVNGGWIFMGMITFLDPPRHDTKRTIELAHEYGVNVKMITGDQGAIAVETCRQLGMGSTILGADVLPHSNLEDGLGPASNLGHDYGAIVESADGFAQVFPEHKFLIVEILRQRGWICGMTGDGVNDAASLKKADIGIAVEGATDAARAAADIVLTKPGLSVIVNAIVLSRQIFQRMRNYVTYRLATSMQLLLFFFLSIVLFRPDSCKFAHFVPRPGNGVCATIANDDGAAQTEAVDPYFKLPVIALVLITILNDGTIISLAYDRVVAPKHAETWNLPRIVWLAVTLGLFCVVSSLLLLFWGLDSWNPHGVLARYGVGQLSYDQVMMMMYLKISLSDFLTVFAARTEAFFFARVVPGKLLLGVACFSMLLSTLVALFWPFTSAMTSIPFKLVLFVWVYCAIWFVLQDLGKLMMVRVLDGIETRNLHEAQLSLLHFQRQEIKRQNRIRLGSCYISPRSGSEATLRDSFIAGRAVRMSNADRNLTLDQAMDRLMRLEAETRQLRQVIQTASSTTCS